jgi:hypothetical protein
MPTDREFHEGWDFLYFIARHAEDGMFVGVAEIQKQGQLHCKLVSVRPETTNQFAIDHLREQCRAWAADWAARPHTGDTAAMPLE